VDNTDSSINAKINTTNIPEISYILSTFGNDEKAGLSLAYSTDSLLFEVNSNQKT
jgi:hypothetical protein